MITSSADRGTPSAEHPSRWSLLWFAALFVAAIGIANGISNQNLYLLYGLRLADPSFLPGDWFTWQTVPSHEAYGVFVSWLARLGHLEAWLAVGVVLQNAAFALSLWWIIRKLYGQALVPWAATLLLLGSMQTMSLGAAPWMKPFLGASTLSSAAMTVGLAFVLDRRFLACGIAMGFAGLFHAHFFVLALVPVAAISLALVWPGGPERRGAALVRLWLPFLIISLPSAIQVWRFTQAPGLDEIAWLTPSLFPYHVDPRSWGNQDLMVLGGALLFGVAGFLAHRPRADRFVVAPWGMIAAAVMVSLVLARFDLLSLASRTWPWRLSPLLLTAGLVAGFGGVWNASRSRALVAASGLVGLLCTAYFGRPALRWTSLALAGAVSASILTTLRGDRRSPRRTTTALLLLSLGFLPLAWGGVQESHFEFRPQRASRESLYDWIRANTQPSDTFAIPPSWEGFRLNARRPIVVDWKAVPRYPRNRIEWVERMEAITGMARPSSNRLALDDAYQQMDCDRVRHLVATYHVRFVVLDRERDLACATVVYEDARYRVYDVSGLSATASTDSP